MASWGYKAGALFIGGILLVVVGFLLLRYSMDKDNKIANVLPILSLLPALLGLLLILSVFGFFPDVPWPHL